MTKLNGIKPEERRVVLLFLLPSLFDVNIALCVLSRVGTNDLWLRCDWDITKCKKKNLNK